MFKILSKRRLNPTMTWLVIDAPLVAKKARPGQFIILRTDEYGERIPLTMAGHDAEKGTIDLIYAAVGRTTMLMDQLEEGDYLLDVVGPLGKPTHMEGLKRVAVVGGGNAAVQEALFLSTLCKKVHLIHRRNQLRADSCTVERVLQNDKITLHTPYVVDTLQEQEEQLTGLLLKNQENNSIQKLDVEGVFIAIGQKPDNAPFANLNICSSQGYIQAEADTLTSVPGLFAAGDCRNKKIRQLTTACGDGTIAAMAACKFLEN